jgi:ankyrin repeat protein
MIHDPNNMQTSLKAAIERGDVDQIRQSVHGGADVNLADEGGWTALHHAVAARQLRAVQALIDLGANAKVADATGLDAEHYAALLGDQTLLQAVHS